MNNWDYETNYNQLEQPTNTESLVDCANYCANEPSSNFSSLF